MLQIRRMSLQTKLAAWQKAEIITSKQAQDIAAYEESHGGKGWIVYGVAGVGVVTLATGIISIIAANWENIGEQLKLILFFLMQGGLALALFRQDPRPGVVREVLLTLYCLLALAGMGLVAQVYNLSGGGYQSLFYWCAITLPVVVLSASRLVNHIWVLIFGGAAIWWIAEGEDRLAYFSAVAIAFVTLAAGAFRRPWYSAYFARAAKIWAFLALAAISVFAHFSWNNGYMRTEYMLNLFATKRLFYSTLFLPLCMSLSAPQFSKESIVATWLGAFALCFYVASPLAGWFPVGERSGAFFFIALWALIAAAAALTAQKRIFDLATFIIGARFVAIYFEIFGSMSATGLGLIGSGLLILGTLYLWVKYRYVLMGKFSKR